MSPESPAVLLVENDAARVNVLTSWLAPEGYRVRVAGDRREAQAVIEDERLQFLIAAAENQAEGVELCRWLRAHGLPHYVYAVLLTERNEPELRTQGLEAGADDVLPHSTPREELLARLRVGQRVLDLEYRLNQAAKRDSLTGLYTQRTFFELLGTEWARAKRYHIPLSCVMVDIDFFKRINDTYGHGVGDEVIRRVAQVLETHTRPGDLVSRYGGEEFCVLLPETEERRAAAWADRVRQVLAEEPVSVGEKRLHITASFGVAQLLAYSSAPEELVDMADQALLISKRTGRDQVTSYQTMNDSPALKAAKGQTSAFEGLLARDVMTTIVAGLPQHEKVGRAVEYFLQLRINSAPVVDDDGRLVGVLSEKDAMAILLLPRWWEATIADVMKKGIVTYDEDTPAQTVYEFLCRVALRSVVVVKDGRPTGILSRSSLLRWFTSALIAKGEAGGLGGIAAFAEDPEELEEQLSALAGKLREEAQRLERSIVAHADDLKPRIVGGVSRMQEMLNDLLGFSQSVDLEPRSPAREDGDESDEGACGPTARGLHALLGRISVES